MPRIGRYPPFGKSFFRHARKIVGNCHFAHFWRVVMCLASMQGRRSLVGMQAMAKERRSRQAIAFFLTRSQWDAPALLAQTALQTLRKLGFQPGDTVYVAIDDTQIEKFGKRMDAVSKIFLHAQKRYAMGHTVLGCALIYRGVVIPYSVAVWTPRDFRGRPFRKLTEMAGDLIDEVALPADARPIVLFDAYYLCPAVTEACQRRQFFYIGASRKNRRFVPDGRPRDSRKLQTYGRNVLAREGRVRKIGDRRYRLAERVGTLRKAGRVKLVFNRRLRESSWRILVTNHLKWGPKTVLQHYLMRWQIELLFKTSKQYLGLGDYQMLRYTGVVRHLHLVLIAHLLLTHLALAEPDAQAAVKHGERLRLPGTQQLQATLRSLIWKDTLATMENSKKYQAAARKLRNNLLF